MAAEAEADGHGHPVHLTRSERFWLAKWMREDWRMRMWERSRTLYSGTYNATIREVLIRDFERAGFGLPEPPLPSAEVVADVYEPRRSGGQRAAFLIPATPNAPCAQCGTGVQVGFHCLACNHASCRSCVRYELHRCSLAVRTSYEIALARFSPVHSRHRLPKIEPEHVVRERIERLAQSRKPEVAIRAARALAALEKRRLEAAIARGQRERGAANRRALRQRLRSMSAAVRRIVSGTADGAEARWLADDDA